MRTKSKEPPETIEQVEALFRYPVIVSDFSYRTASGSAFGLVQVGRGRYCLALFDTNRGAWQRFNNKAPAARAFLAAQLLTVPLSTAAATAALGIIQSQRGYRIENAEASPVVGIPKEGK